MTVQWPEFLSLLAALPLLAAFYLYVLRRKKKFAVRYSNMALVKEAMRGPSWRRHVPPFLLGLALAALIVAFAGTATVAQAPTKNKEDLYAAIDRFQLQRATAIGSAIIVSLATLFPDGGYDVSAYSYGAEKRKPPANFKPVPPGSYGSAVIILLSDGQRTTGPDSVMAARLAAERGVRIFTVGVGTPEGKIVGFDGWSMHVRLDEETLRAIADLTRGEYFYAGNAVDLKKIYQTMNSRMVMETKKTELGAFFAAAAALLVLAGGLLSLAWFNRIV